MSSNRQQQVDHVAATVELDARTTGRIGVHTLRQFLERARYEEMRAVIERHGGTVEKFVGDAVMAVFGVPRAHEDDALRAVRAAAEMQEAATLLGKSPRASGAASAAAATIANPPNEIGSIAHSQ